MVLASPLIHERVWLDKPKYDAAERLYYEKLSQSLASSNAEASTSLNTSGVPSEPEIIDDEVCVNSQPQQNKPLKSSPNTNENICKRSNGAPVCKKPNKNAQDKTEGKQAKEDEPTVCSVPNKAEKVKKSVTEPSDVVCQKSKPSTKSNLKNSAEQSVQPATEQICELSKPKGFYLPTKPLLPQPDSSLSKGTNVNTIPEISNLNPVPVGDKSKPSLQVKKLNQLNRVPTLDKQESTDLIIPTSIITNESLPPDDQGKKEIKKKKKNKKDRHRDNKKGVTQNSNSWNSLAGEVAKARQHIKNSLQCIDDIAVTSNTVSVEVANRVVSLEKENHELTNRMEKLEARIASLEKQLQLATAAAAASTGSKKEPAKKPPVQQNNDDDDEDDGVDLFASDSEEEDLEASKIKEQRLAEYAAKKSKKPVLIAKSSIVLDVKPWDDETDMKKMEEEVRKISADGLLWGASKLVPLAFGIHKLQISCVVEDEKVSVDWLQETMQEIEDYVQSVDIAAFNKI